jgi:type I restriction enzyme S subunit
MKEWKSYKLGEISTIQTGPFGSQLHQSDYVESGVPCIMPTNIGRMLDFQVAGIAHISEGDALKLSRHIVHEGDIVYSRRGDIEKCAYVSQEQDGWFCGTGCLKITINSNLAVPKFVAYYLSTDEIKSWIVGNAVGTTMLNLNTSVLADVPLSLPSIQMQKRCVQILDSIENKIALNNRINHNLEEQAQALYKSWFVDFEPFKDGRFVDSEIGMIPEGWKVVHFLDIAKLCGGGTPKTDIDAFWDGPIPFFTPKDVKASPFCLKTEKTITENGLKHCNSQLYDVYTTFITARGTVGKLCMAGAPMAMNQTNYAICSKSGINAITIYLMCKQIVANLKNKANGAVFDAITTRDFEGESIIAAPDSIMTRFSRIVRPIFDQILHNEKQTLTLMDQRDSVLPRLMSGGIGL